jgi:hypothetical protein
MPLSALAEIILQPVIEVVAHVFGYLTSIVVVPALTLGFFRVERLLDDERSRPKLKNIRADMPRPRVISADAGTAFGLLFWVLVAVAVYFFKFHD